MPELHAGDPAWIGPFRLRERLGDGDGDGAGSLGPLYLGQSPLAHLVTIRALRPDLAADKALRARLTRDMAAAREVTGPHVAPLVGADLSGPVPWFAWEWVPGESLAGTVGQWGPLAWSAFAALAIELAEGIWSLHEADVVHGDLTPGSVFLARDGAVVTGFGVCAAVAALRAGAATVPADALQFLSPEQAAGGEATPASDMFSLGAVLAYALCGAGPFPGHARAGDGHAIDYGLRDLDGVPGFLRPLITRCLRLDPAARPPSGGFAALLATTIRAQPARVIAAMTSSPKPPSPGPPAPAPPTPAPAAALPAAAPATTSPPAVPPDVHPPVSPPLPTGNPPAGVGTASRLVRTTSTPVPLVHPARTARERRLAGAAVALVVVVITIVGLSTIGSQDSAAPKPPVPGAVQLALDDYKTGDCLSGQVTMDSSPWPDDLWAVPCSDSHTYEVFYANHRFYPADGSFPGAEVVDSDSARVCDAQFLRYTGLPDALAVSYTRVTPVDAASWGDGYRGIVCIAFNPDLDHPNGAPVNLSLKGIGNASS